MEAKEGAVTSKGLNLEMKTLYSIVEIDEKEEIL